MFQDQGLNLCPCIGRQILINCTTSEVPPFAFLEAYSWSGEHCTAIITSPLILAGLWWLRPIESRKVQPDES